MPFKYNPLTGELDLVAFTGSGTPALQFDTDLGSAYPDGSGVINFLGSGSLTFTGSGDTVTVSIDSALSVSEGGTGLTSVNTGDILYASGSNTLTALPSSTDGYVLTLSSGVPTWAENASGQVDSVSGTPDRITISGTATDPIVDIASTYVGQATITTLGTVTTGTWNADTVTVPYGGTGATSLTDGGILLGSGTSAVTVTSQPTDGQLLIGSTGLDPVLANLASADGSVTITNGGGTIDLAVAAGDDAILTVTGDTGGALSPTAGNLNIKGSGNLSTSGFSSTLTLIQAIDYEQAFMYGGM